MTTADAKARSAEIPLGLLLCTRSACLSPLRLTPFTNRSPNSLRAEALLSSAVPSARAGASSDSNTGNTAGGEKPQVIERPVTPFASEAAQNGAPAAGQRLFREADGEAGGSTTVRAQPEVAEVWFEASAVPA